MIDQTDTASFGPKLHIAQIIERSVGTVPDVQASGIAHKSKPGAKGPGFTAVLQNQAATFCPNSVLLLLNADRWELRYLIIALNNDRNRCRCARGGQRNTDPTVIRRRYGPDRYETEYNYQNKDNC